MVTIGCVEAKNKEEACEKVYAAFWGAENDAIIYAEESGRVGLSSKSRMVATINK
jgi:hypothetical protein